MGGFQKRTILSVTTCKVSNGLIVAQKWSSEFRVSVTNVQRQEFWMRSILFYRDYRKNYVTLLNYDINSKL